jgi:hypothetical protein
MQFRTIQSLTLGMVLFAVPSLYAQHSHHETKPEPAELLEGLGNHVHPIATDSELAQRFFNQGLALIKVPSAPFRVRHVSEL